MHSATICGKCFPIFQANLNFGVALQCGVVFSNIVERCKTAVIQSGVAALRLESLGTMLPELRRLFGDDTASLPISLELGATEVDLVILQDSPEPLSKRLRFVGGSGSSHLWKQIPEVRPCVYPPEFDYRATHRMQEPKELFGDLLAKVSSMVVQTDTKPQEQVEVFHSYLRGDDQVTGSHQILFSPNFQLRCAGGLWSPKTAQPDATDWWLHIEDDVEAVLNGRRPADPALATPVLKVALQERQGSILEADGLVAVSLSEAAANKSGMIWAPLKNSWLQMQLAPSEGYGITIGVDVDRRPGLHEPFSFVHGDWRCEVDIPEELQVTTPSIWLHLGQPGQNYLSFTSAALVQVISPPISTYMGPQREPGYPPGVSQPSQYLGLTRIEFRSTKSTTATSSFLVHFEDAEERFESGVTATLWQQIDGSRALLQLRSPAGANVGNTPVGTVTVDPTPDFDILQGVVPHRVTEVRRDGQDLVAVAGPLRETLISGCWLLLPWVRLSYADGAWSKRLHHRNLIQEVAELRVAGFESAGLSSLTQKAGEQAAQTRLQVACNDFSSNLAPLENWLGLDVQVKEETVDELPAVSAYRQGQRICQLRLVPRTADEPRWLHLKELSSDGSSISAEFGQVDDPIMAVNSASGLVKSRLGYLDGLGAHHGPNAPAQAPSSPLFVQTIRHAGKTWHSLSGDVACEDWAVRFLEFHIGGAADELKNDTVVSGMSRGYCSMVGGALKFRWPTVQGYAFRMVGLAVERVDDSYWKLEIDACPGVPPSMGLSEDQLIADSGPAIRFSVEYSSLNGLSRPELANRTRKVRWRLREIGPWVGLAGDISLDSVGWKLAVQSIEVLAFGKVLAFPVSFELILTAEGFNFVATSTAPSVRLSATESSYSFRLNLAGFVLLVDQKEATVEGFKAAGTKQGNRLYLQARQALLIRSLAQETGPAQFDLTTVRERFEQITTNGEGTFRSLEVRSSSGVRTLHVSLYRGATSGQVLAVNDAVAAVTGNSCDATAYFWNHPLGGGKVHFPAQIRFRDNGQNWEIESRVASCYVAVARKVTTLTTDSVPAISDGRFGWKATLLEPDPSASTKLVLVDLTATTVTLYLLSALTVPFDLQFDQDLFQPYPTLPQSCPQLSNRTHHRAGRLRILQPALLDKQNIEGLQPVSIAAGETWELCPIAPVDRGYAALSQPFLLEKTDPVTGAETYNVVALQPALNNSRISLVSLSNRGQGEEDRSSEFFAGPAMLFRRTLSSGFSVDYQASLSDNRTPAFEAALPSFVPKAVDARVVAPRVALKWLMPSSPTPYESRSNPLGPGGPEEVLWRGVNLNPISHTRNGRLHIVEQALYPGSPPLPSHQVDCPSPISADSPWLPRFLGYQAGPDKPGGTFRHQIQQVGSDSVGLSGQALMRDPQRLQPPPGAALTDLNLARQNHLLVANWVEVVGELAPTAAEQLVSYRQERLIALDLKGEQDVLLELPEPDARVSSKVTSALFLQGGNQKLLYLKSETAAKSRLYSLGDLFDLRFEFGGSLIGLALLGDNVHFCSHHFVASVDPDSSISNKAAWHLHEDVNNIVPFGDDVALIGFLNGKCLRAVDCRLFEGVPVAASHDEFLLLRAGSIWVVTSDTPVRKVDHVERALGVPGVLAAWLVSSAQELQYFDGSATQVKQSVKTLLAVNSGSQGSIALALTPGNALALFQEGPKVEPIYTWTPAEAQYLSAAAVWEHEGVVRWAGFDPRTEAVEILNDQTPERTRLIKAGKVIALAGGGNSVHIATADGLIHRFSVSGEHQWTRDPIANQLREFDRVGLSFTEGTRPTALRYPLSLTAPYLIPAASTERLLYLQTREGSVRVTDPDGDDAPREDNFYKLEADKQYRINSDDTLTAVLVELFLLSTKPDEPKTRCYLSTPPPLASVIGLVATEPKEQTVVVGPAASTSRPKEAEVLGNARFRVSARGRFAVEDPAPAATSYVLIKSYLEGQTDCVRGQLQ
ncbi:MAG: hypothetical protein KIS61_16670 [Candidatus Eremiobacteraeota bacterium]|nr:hypothetical protein [Candidatus Eremiobacteraeota bacterium]